MAAQQEGMSTCSLARSRLGSTRSTRLVTSLYMIIVYRVFTDTHIQTVTGLAFYAQAYARASLSAAIRLRPGTFVEQMKVWFPAMYSL